MYRQADAGGAVGEATNAGRWSAARIAKWYARQPWLLGANYVPASASNQLEMWSARSFAPDEIDRELGWASMLGMNTMRVFLTDLLWSQDADSFASRIDTFLGLASRHGIRPMFVLFDSCWHDAPSTPAAPQPGVHNSAWLQAPGEPVLLDPSEWPHLRAYVEGIVGRFARDKRVLAWDLWNEPCNPGNPHRPNRRAREKFDAVAALLPQVFDWARAASPAQPLTAGLWQHDDWSPDAALTEVERVQIERSDILSFHDYGNVEQFAARVAQLKAWGRPVLCTEWLARTAGSTIDAILPAARRLDVGMMNWGLVAGRTQTTLPWDSWVTPYADTPEVWFHDLLRPDGTPFCEVEAAMMRALAALDCAPTAARAAVRRTPAYAAGARARRSARTSSS